MTDNRDAVFIGKRAEEQACHFLEKKGLQLLERNYRRKCGEIDLIMRDKDNIIFVEVRLRNNPFYGNAFESVTRHKQKKIIKTATVYLCQQKWLDKVNCRFDVIGISYRTSTTETTIEWVKNAFSANNF